jgi:hypothetical protein
MPTLTRSTKPKPSTIYVCWQSFAGNEGLSVAEGTRLLGSHELVQRFPDRFVPDGTPDDEVAQLRAAAAAPPPAPEPLGRVKLRVLPGTPGIGLLDGGRDREVFAHGRTFTSGQTFESEGKDAEHLISVGACEIVKHLQPKREAA